MSTFRDRLTDEHSGRLDRSRNHPLFNAVASGTISDATVDRWFSQEYLCWNQAFVRFTAKLISRLPRPYRRILLEPQMAMLNQVELFEGVLQARGIDTSAIRISFPGHAYACHLLAVAAVGSFEEALATCYGTSYSYIEAWMAARRSLRATVSWSEIAVQRTEGDIRDWVDRVAELMDRVARDVPVSVLSSMSESFGAAIDYQLSFWDGILAGVEW